MLYTEMVILRIKGCIRLSTHEQACYTKCCNSKAKESPLM